MSHPNSPHPCLFFCSFIYKEEELVQTILKNDLGAWGAVLDLSPAFPFTWTSYYASEQGTALLRKFVCFEPLMEDPAHLRTLKIQARAVEDLFSANGKRRVNLDPGYLNSHQVILSTFKNFAHRIWLGEGVYAHLEYLFKKGEPIPLPWTYPDFRSEEYRAVFRMWKEVYERLRDED